MYTRPFTPEYITELKPNEVFVFGSNCGLSTPLITMPTEARITGKGQ